MLHEIHGNMSPYRLNGKTPRITYNYHFNTVFILDSVSLELNECYHGDGRRAGKVQIPGFSSKKLFLKQLLKLFSDLFKINYFQAF